MALTAHVISSVGWLGAVIVFLALAVAGARTSDDAVGRSAYITMNVLGTTTLVPLSLLALATGLIQSLGTTWGLVRHYWVIVKLLINVVATGVLLLYLQTLEYFDGLARSGADLNDFQNASPAVHAAGAAALLTIATVMSIFKPGGVTRRGWRYTQPRSKLAAATMPARPAQPSPEGTR